MKKLFNITLFLALFSLVAVRDREEYESHLSQIKEAVDNFNNEKYYEPYDIRNKKTGEIKKISDLKDLDKNLFFLFEGEELTYSLESLEKLWREDLDKLNGDKQKIDEVKKYIEQLRGLRIKLALKFENHAEMLFKKFPDAFTQEEKEYTMKTIREYHDKNQLVKRKK
jgi:hypothetical protein